MYDWFNNTEATRVLADKNLFDMLFHDARQPKTIVRRLYGRYMDDRYAALTFEEAVRRCREQKSVIVKPTVKASSGVGIVFWSEEEGEEALLPLLKGGDNFVVQEVVRQHPALAALHKESVNTIRMMTCYFEGEMSVLSSIVRIGVGSARVDNASQGGIICGIKEDGSLRKYAYNLSGDTFERHPQGYAFAGRSVPGFERCKALVMNLANRVLGVARLVSWDLSVSEDGEPILIEMNIICGGTDIHQITNGPIYGDKTERIVSKALSAKKYRLYRNRF